MSAPIRLDLLVVGRVQGVGFRASTVALAAQHGVTGYVRNLPDGNVEVVVEGTDEAVHAFWRALSQHRIYRHVRSEHPRTGTASGRFGGFSIRYD